jgi:saccharopine dehydrogenase-like NADP-dependent oxidoreductase
MASPKGALFGITGGYGATGLVIVEELARRRLGPIIASGRNIHHAEELAARFDDVRPMRVDVSEDSELNALCAQCQIIINCLHIK